MRALRKLTVVCSIPFLLGAGNAYAQAFQAPKMEPPSFKPPPLGASDLPKGGQSLRLVALNKATLQEMWQACQRNIRGDIVVFERIFKEVPFEPVFKERIWEENFFEGMPSSSNSGRYIYSHYITNPTEDQCEWIKSNKFKLGLE